MATGSVYINTVIQNVADSKLYVERGAFATWRTTGTSPAMPIATPMPSEKALGKRPRQEYENEEARGSESESDDEEEGDDKRERGVISLSDSDE